MQLMPFALADLAIIATIAPRLIAHIATKSIPIYFTVLLIGMLVAHNLNLSRDTTLIDTIIAKGVDNMITLNIEKHRKCIYQEFHCVEDFDYVLCELNPHRFDGTRRGRFEKRLELEFGLN